MTPYSGGHCEKPPAKAAPPRNFSTVTAFRHIANFNPARRWIGAHPVVRPTGFDQDAHPLGEDAEHRSLRRVLYRCNLAVRSSDVVKEVAPQGGQQFSSRQPFAFYAGPACDGWSSCRPVVCSVVGRNFAKSCAEEFRMVEGTVRLMGRE